MDNNELIKKINSVRWVKCRNKSEWICDVCNRVGDELPEISHPAEYGKNKNVRALYAFENRLGSIAVCSDCENHKERLLSNFFMRNI